jgi:hypothetical protein
LSNESLHDPSFRDAASLKSAGIVKDVTVMIGEYKFILDAVFAALVQESVAHSKAKYYFTNLRGRIKFNLWRR